MSEAGGSRKNFKLRLFGTMQASVDGKPIPPLRSRKGDWLLALLALRRGGVSRSWLAGTLWPESVESRALLYLRRELTFLRKALGPQSDRLISSGRSLRLDLAGAECDLPEFDSAIARGDESSLETAASLYAGPLLEGCDEEWAVLERTPREEANLSALERLADLSLNRGDFPAAIRRLRTLVTSDPLRESAQRSLMKALAENGDAAAATQVYRNLRVYLRSELNADVAPETVSLYSEIREGIHRRIVASHGATHGSIGPRVVKIPLPLTQLVGRNLELWEVRQRLRTSRILTLTGTGGVGKTRLAVETAERLKDDFTGGVCFVELASVRDSDLVARAVMDALGLKSTPRQSFREALVDRLRGSDLLLILDNCEQVVDSCAELAAALLGDCARLRILTTSREPLGITGESVWRVPSLSVPPAFDRLAELDKNTVSQIMQYESVALFVERAQQVRSGFTMTTQNAESVARLCRRLDGIPLAIELAAARTRSLSVEEVDNRLDQCFSLLTGGSRTALPRHQTLRSLVDWSYDLLNEAEKAMLCRLSVFSGGWTLQAAEEVCSDPGVSDDSIETRKSKIENELVCDVLTSLADKSIVVAENLEEGNRYRLLETMRQYALERLHESGDCEAWRARHCACYLALAEEAEPHLSGASQQYWFELLDADHDNLRTALAWSAEQFDRLETGFRLAGALWRFWIVRGYVGEGWDWLTRLLAQGNETMRTECRAKALYGAGNLAWQQGDCTRAKALFEEALDVANETGDLYAVAMSRNGLGLVATQVGDYCRSQEEYGYSLEMFRRIVDQRGVALALNNLGDVAVKREDALAARRLYSESLEIRRDIGDRWGIANSLGNLGALAHEQGDFVRARELLDESLLIRRQIGDKGGTAWCLIDLGSVACDQRDYASARGLYLESLSIECALGEKPGIAESLNGIAVVEAALDDPLRAARIWGAAERLREQIGVTLPPIEKSRLETQVWAARTIVGEETHFDAAWHEGRAMTLEQSIRFAADYLRVAAALSSSDGGGAGAEGVH